MCRGRSRSTLWQCNRAIPPCIQTKPDDRFRAPVNYLLRMERPVSRIGRIIRKAVKSH
jgi:hypothetical protein